MFKATVALEVLNLVIIHASKPIEYTKCYESILYRGSYPSYVNYKFANNYGKVVWLSIVVTLV